MLFEMRQLAQRGHISAADRAGGDPPLPSSPLGFVLFNSDSCLRLRGAGDDEEMMVLLCRFFSFEEAFCQGVFQS